MSFNLPPLKVKANRTPCVDIKQGVYGIPDPMTYGLTAGTPRTVVHPLETSEKNYAQNQHKLNMAVLRNVQGLHAPLRIATELNSFNSVGRLPFLPSSNFHKDVLLGNDESLDYSDFLNIPEFQECYPQPHAFMESKYGIL